MPSANTSDIGLKLINAAICGDVKTATSLLAIYNVDINFKNDNGSTPLMLAVFHSQKEMVQLLLHHKADVDYQNALGETAVIIAAEVGNIEIMQLLLEKNPDLNYETQYGDTALMQATWKGHEQIVRLLLENTPKPQINHTNNMLLSALTLAIQNKNTNIIKLLLEHNADHTQVKAGKDVTLINELLEKISNKPLTTRLLSFFPHASLKNKQENILSVLQSVQRH